MHGLRSVSDAVKAWRHFVRRRDNVLRTDVGVISGAAIVIAFANAPTSGGGITIARGARMDDGKLDVCVVCAMAKLRLQRLFPSVYSGRHLNFAEVEYFQEAALRIETEKIVGGVRRWRVCLPDAVASLRGASGFGCHRPSAAWTLIPQKGVLRVRHFWRPLTCSPRKRSAAVSAALLFASPFF